MTNMPRVSKDEDESDDKDTAITCTLNTTPSEELLSPKGKAAMDKIGRCKACDDKPHLFIRKRNNRKREVLPDRMSTCLVYQVAEEKDRLEMLMKTKGCCLCTSWSHQQQNGDIKIKQHCRLMVQ